VLVLWVFATAVGSSLFATEARESRLVAGVDGGSVLTTATGGATEAATATVTATATVAAASTTLTTASTTTTTGAGAATASATGTLGLDEAGVEVDGLLDLALALTLLLGSASGDVDVLVVLLEGFGVGPLLVELGALVGLADLEASVEAELLLGELSKVVGVRDALILGLSRLLASTILNKSLLLLALSDGLASLLVLQLGLTLVGAPGSVGLLVGSAKRLSATHISPDIPLQVTDLWPICLDGCLSSPPRALREPRPVIKMLAGCEPTSCSTDDSPFGILARLRTTTDASALTATALTAGSLIGASSTVAIGADTTIPESCIETRRQ
jgi:hypothetical protein